MSAHFFTTAPISFQHWGAGQPCNSLGNEHVVELQSSEDHLGRPIDFKWNDIRESSTDAAALCVFYV